MLVEPSGVEYIARFKKKREGPPLESFRAS